MWIATFPMAGTLIIVLTCIGSLVSNEEHEFSPSISQTKTQIFFLLGELFPSGDLISFTVLTYLVQISQWTF